MVVTVSAEGTVGTVDCWPIWPTGSRCVGGLGRTSPRPCILQFGTRRPTLRAPACKRNSLKCGRGWCLRRLVYGVRRGVPPTCWPRDVHGSAAWTVVYQVLPVRTLADTKSLPETKSCQRGRSGAHDPETADRTRTYTGQTEAVGSFWRLTIYPSARDDAQAFAGKWLTTLR